MYLMHKDNMIAKLNIMNGKPYEVEEIYKADEMPFGTIGDIDFATQNIILWHCGRTIPYGRLNLDKIEEKIGNVDDLSIKSYGLSLTDCYWFDTPHSESRGILVSTTTALANTLRYRNVLHSVHKLDYTVPVCPTVQFCISMSTAFAVLYSKYLHLHLYLCYVWYDNPDTPIHESPDFSPVDFYTHSRNRSDCLGTWLVL